MMKYSVVLGGKNAHFMADPHLWHIGALKYNNRPFKTPEEDLELARHPKNVYGGYSREDVVGVRVSRDSVIRMNEAIVSNTNEQVRSNGYLFLLGDVGYFETVEEFNNIRDKIVCQHIYLVPGNHDEINFFTKCKNITILSDIARIQVHGQDIILSHYPLLSWEKSHKGAWSLFGHVHCMRNKWIEEHLPEAKMLDVGVDGHNYKPWSFLEIKEYMRNKSNTL